MVEMEALIALLPGDGIGREVTSAAAQVLEKVGLNFGHTFKFCEVPLGGEAIDRFGDPLPQFTLHACRSADALLLGAVGGPRWDDPTAPVRPEQGLLRLRKELDLFANLRPIRPHPDLKEASPLRPELLAQVDILFVRELTGDIYFGQPRLRRQVNGQVQALDTMTYTQGEIERVARLAFSLARQRRGLLTSIDKANVLECSRLWRQVVGSVAGEFPDITLEHMLVDAAAMHLLSRPASFDVVLTGNLFGDILTDEASLLSGSLGILPSAALGSSLNRFGLPRGLYEPIHGSAPDLAGKGTANPLGTILSAALLLRHSLGLELEANALEAAVHQAIAGGCRTADLGGEAGTAHMTAAVLEQISCPIFMTA
jgi:3-isopropylmalate dehydrogenase